MKPASNNLPARPASFLELLEERIAPAIIEGGIATAVAGTPILLGDGVDSQGRQLPRGLGSDGPFAGGYYLYVEKGQALVFTTDLNGNNNVDPNEITGIAAGAGLRLLSFVNINGDIATNLNADGTLTDSDGDASNGRDGSVVLNNRIEAITLRSVVQEDLTTSTNPASPAFGNTAFNRLVESRYSIYGNIYAGGGLGTLAADGRTATYGVLMDTSGLAAQGSKYSNLWFNDVEPTPSVGSIFTGTAVSGHQFSFGTSVIPDANKRDTGTLIVRGSFDSFTPAAGAAGGDVIGIRAVTGPDLTPADYYIGGIQTGDGGFGAKGGDIRNVNLQGDVGGFFAIAGNGGNGVSGGAGGSVLGFVATASPNSTVTIQTGDGGFGLLGAAGRAGNFQAGGTLDLYGTIVVGLGSGGDSTGNAGAGTNLASATFQRFAPGDTAPVNFISTMRAPGELGTATPFDFDGNGVFDVVFLTQNTQQLGVAFGDGAGRFLSNFLILDPSIYATSDLRMSPVAVADLNNDGFAEIITASSSGTTFGGIKTFWNLGNDPFSGQWLGFDAPRYSPSPFGDRGADTNLALGDFDHDGMIDVALVENFRNLTNPITYSSAITLLSGLRGADGAPDGFFAANYAKDPVTGLPTLSPFTLIAVRESEVQVILKATASVKDDPKSDMLVGLTRKDSNLSARINTYGFTPGGMDSLGIGSNILYSSRSMVLGTVVYAVPPSIVDAYDFSLVNVPGDNLFDVAVFGESDGFAAAAVFPGTASGALGPQPLLPGNYYGIAITAPNAEAGQPQIPRVVGSALEHKVARAIDINPALGEVAYGAEVNTEPFASARIFSFSINGFGQGDITVTGAPLGILVEQDAQAVLNSGAATRDMYFGVYKQIPSSPLDYAGLSRPIVAAVWALGPVASLPSGATLVTNSLELLAGNGGQSYLGRGGDGGSIGAGVVAFNSAGVRTGSITEIGFEEADFQAGNAGSGSLGGGNGGGVAGISTRGLSRTLIAGAGGDSLLGNGGSGGTYSGNFFDGVNTDRKPSELLVQAGDGGFGLRGGSGGRVLGGGDPNLPDAVVHELTVVAGSGGQGITGGGAGGAISNFQPQMGRGTGVPDLLSASLLDFAGGSGGDAVAGPGGAGGAITSSSPTPDYNSFTTGSLKLEGGAGGDGLTGGVGGSIVTFFNRPSSPGSPDSAKVFGGAGGDAVTGAGGNGGNVQGVQVTTSALTLFAVLGGNGGLSSAGAGGAGGSLIGGTAGNQVASGGGSMVAAAGAGGVGFTRGGAGGSVSGSYNASNNANGGVVAIAGAGGSAYGVNFATIQKENPSSSGVSAAALPLFQQLWTLGSANGVGGNGGSISNFTQPAGKFVSTDLIAGNGGSTVNYGVVSDQTTGVGRGGSISNVKLAGDAGTWAQNLAIKSYVAFGRPMNDFVADVRATIVTTLDPTVGNVGVVVGQAGFVRNDQPATAGVTGSVSGFEAQRIMSMVAGSVDRLAAITSVSGLRFSEAGAFKVFDAQGARPDHVNGNAYYAGSNYTGGVVKDASPGGTLVDGAVLTRKFTALPGQPPPQRLFTIA